MDIVIRARQATKRVLRSFSIDIPDSLPLLETVAIERTSDEICSRLLAMHAAAAVAFGFPRPNAINWIHAHDIGPSLSPDERAFIFNGESHPQMLMDQIEGMWVLAWAISIVDSMDFRKTCDDQFVFMLPNLKVMEDPAAFYGRATTRSLDDLVQACDLAFGLHWALREAELTNKSPEPRWPTEALVVNRRRAIEWILHEEPWHEIALDT